MKDNNSGPHPRSNVAETLSTLAKAMNHRNASTEQAAAFPPTKAEREKVLDAYCRIASREVRQALLDVLVSAAGDQSKPW